MVVVLLALFAPARAADPAPTNPGVGAAASVAPADKLANAKAFLEEMREIVVAVEKLATEAKEKGETPETLQCLNSRVTSLKALVTVSETAERNLQTALAGTDPASAQRANFEYRKLTVAITKARSLLGEAQRCSSTAELTAPQTTVDWEAYLVGDDGFASTTTSVPTGSTVTSPTDTTLYR